MACEYIWRSLWNVCYEDDVKMGKGIPKLSNFVKQVKDPAKYEILDWLREYPFHLGIKDNETDKAGRMVCCN